MRQLARVAPPVLLAVIACAGGRRERVADSAHGATATAVAESASATAALMPSDTSVRDTARRVPTKITPSSGGAVTTPTPRAPGAPPAGAVSPTSTASAPNGAAAAPAAGAPPAAPAQTATQTTAPAAEPAAAAPVQAPATQPAPAPTPAPARALPFGIGEHLEYQVKYGFLGVGHASMDVVGTEEVRGTRTLHTVFRVNGGIRLYSVNDRYESWFDPRTMSSLRYVAQIDEGSYERERRFEIYPERKVFTENNGPEQPSVADPLDDGSFIYFVRDYLQHNPVEVGKEYAIDRYFRPDRNPVRLRILRREQVKVPAGTFQTLVVQPIIKTTGIFSEGGKAQIWFTDDSTRTMVQMKSSLKFGSLNLYLTKRVPGAAGS